VEWLGISWWVWVFVIPELAVTAVWLVFALPSMGIAWLIDRRRERRERS
jgi:hypothetical protein